MPAPDAFPVTPAGTPIGHLPGEQVLAGKRSLRRISRPPRYGDPCSLGLHPRDFFLRRYHSAQPGRLLEFGGGRIGAFQRLSAGTPR
jgi:hypothetical protein